MKLLLAPMEGLIDPPLRSLLTAIGSYEWCVSEFIRVTDMLLPRPVFRRLVPELQHGCTTAAGTPVYVQLLGHQPSVVADNGARAVELGAPGVDINFGCPSTTVNRHGGGAILLREPEKIYAITDCLRRSIPQKVPVTAKVRLGFDDTALTLEIVDAVERAGASLITVHARTKVDGYRPPARWEWLAAIREALTIPVVANGDIVDLQSFQQCQQISGCNYFMLGRGAVINPYLAAQIQQLCSSEVVQPYAWPQYRHFLLQFIKLMQGIENQKGAVSRVKQLLSMQKNAHPQIAKRFDLVKKLQTLDAFIPLLQQEFPE